MEQTPAAAGRRLAPRLVGAAALAVTGAIHLDLYLTGYRHIPTIGGLFLLQVIAAAALAVAVVVLPGPVAPAAGAGFAISTLGGYLLTLWIGLFGFQEVQTTAGLVAGIVEVAAFGVLAYAALTAGPAGSRAAAAVARLRPRLPGGAAGLVAAVSAVALVVLGASLGTAASASQGGGASAGGAGGTGGTGPVVKIIIKNFMFRPANPDVRPGERIEVTNEDPVTHTLTAGPSARDNNVFSTGDVGPDQTRTIDAPRRAGMYPFYCTIHHFMTGILIVGE